MLDHLNAAEELIVAAGKRLGSGLTPEEVGLLKRVVRPLFGDEIFAAGAEEVAAAEVPEDRSELRDWKRIEDSRYLNGAVQIVLLSRMKNIGEKRRAELQTVLALIFHVIRHAIRG